jgi:hypothetical protein
MTGAPVTGKAVVALESEFGDPKIVMSTTADAQGHFQFDNVTPADNAWMLAVAARSSDNSLFAITYLVSGGFSNQQGDKILAGTDVGTITLMPSPTVDLQGTVTSQSSSGDAQNVNITIDPLRTFSLDRNIQVPWLDAPPTTSTLQNEDNCDVQGASCAAFDIRVPSGRAWWAVYNHNGNRFQQFSAPLNYSFFVNAFSQSTAAPDCNPSTQERVILDSNWGQGPIRLHFTSCTP